MKIKTLRVGVFILLCTLLKIAPSQAAIQGEQAVLRALQTGNYVRDGEIKLKAPDAFENRCAIPIDVSAARTFNQGVQIYIVANDKNISALFTPLGDGIGSIQTRIKMLDAQEVNSITAVLVDNKGIYHIASKRHVNATQNALKYPCSNPIKDNPTSTPDLKVRTVDDGVRISARVNSPGYSTILIDKFDFYVDGVKALEAKATPTLATNPIIGFTIKRMVTKVDLDVATSNGQHITASADRDGTPSISSNPSAPSSYTPSQNSSGHVQSAQEVPQVNCLHFRARAPSEGQGSELFNSCEYSVALKFCYSGRAPAAFFSQCKCPNPPDTGGFDPTKNCAAYFNFDSGQRSTSSYYVRYITPENIHLVQCSGDYVYPVIKGGREYCSDETSSHISRGGSSK